MKGVNNMEESMMAGMLVGSMATVIWLIGAVYYVLWIIGLWKVFTKAGEAGWKSLIPFYGVYVQYRLTWKANMMWPVCILLVGGTLLAQYTTGVPAILGAVLCIAGIVLNTIGLHKLSKAFGHGTGFTVGLFFLEPIFTIILGFGKSKYIGNTTEAAAQ